LIIILGWSKNDGDNLPELREAATRFELTHLLATESKEYVHSRSGYPLFLATHNFTYPMVYKICIDTYRDELYEAAADPERFLVNSIVPAPYRQVARRGTKPMTGYNPADRTYELWFYHKLNATSKKQLFDNGWQWHEGMERYYAPFSAEALAFAHSFTGRPRTKL
jgi:hypothetical protein